MKRDYSFFLQAASGKQDATIDAALRAIERFETSTGRRPFSKFHIEQARSFRASLGDQPGPNGRPLSAATITSTLKHLRNFFLWLSREPGYRSRLNANDANYFTPSDQDRRIAAARREGPVPSVDEVLHLLRAMPARTAIEKRNRAVIAFTLLTGARDGALASFRVKHVSLAAGTVFQDGREVNTKRRKTFVTNFFPVGSEPLEIVTDYVALLTNELGFGPDDPLFPATQMAQSEDRNFAAVGLSRIPWRSTGPIRQVFRDAFVAAGQAYVNPHAFRKTLVRLGEALCRSPEEWKAWSQNLGHESEMTTFVGYGEVPGHRQAEIIRALAKPRDASTQSLDLATLEAIVNKAVLNATSQVAAQNKPAMGNSGDV
ncbi:site-specific integrase [Bradyrhizobium sp. STM 3809]|uniref:tyrosine-type recombinase/integrase n=1 Tax=Bradyrhizobium sp. STM 3809 TaxID=551936 RepID=UPI001F0A6867|nr:site-specific integrase [Bradyrhizobium sp. STM 3809]